VDPRDVLHSRFPDAVGGVLAGSAARGEATASSDLDLVVLLPGPPAPMRRTERVDGRLVELFVHTEDSFHAFVERERVQRRSPLLHMVARGRIISDRDGLAARVQEAARALWSAGPAPLTDAEIEDRRYRLTALLDDLADEDDPAAGAVLAAAALLDIADLALALRGHWTGTGRWLMRRLSEVDSSLSEKLVDGLRAALDGEVTALVRCGLDELRRVGGRLDDGYERYG
jgi:predicted nucleotidyltransferase